MQTIQPNNRPSQTAPIHTYNNTNTSDASIQLGPPSSHATESNLEVNFPSTHKETDMNELINTLTIESVHRAINAAELAGYEQFEIQQIAEKMAITGKVVPIVHVPGDNRPYLRVSVNKNESYPLLDSGAMVCVISYTHEDELKKYNSNIQPCSITVTTVTHAQHQVTGVMWLQYEMNGQSACIPTIIMRSHKSYFIVGMNFFRAFDIKLAWGNSCTCSPLATPWCEEVPAIMNGESVTSNEPAIDTHMMQPPSANNIRQQDPAQYVQQTQIGMLSLANRLTRCQQNRLKVNLKKGSPCNEVSHSASSHDLHEEAERLLPTKFKRANECMGKIQNSHYHRHVYTKYEAEEESLKDPEWLQNPNGNDSQASSNVSVAEFALSLLTNMPIRNVSIAEIATQPEIVTAENHDDTFVDTQPQKHCCVTEPHSLSPEQQKILNDVLEEFPYTSESGPLNCTHVYTQRIDTGDAPPEMRRQYQMSPYILAEVEKEIGNLVERQIIEPIDFSAWRWPILWVKKKNGGGRICVDARGLNKIAIHDAYPTLKVDAILQNLPNAKFISCLDMTQAFHQIPIAEEDRDKTAFAVGHKFYRYKRALMGFTNSPADLAKVLDKVFGDMIPKVYHYVDDFIILSATFNEHIELLREVAKRLRNACLTISKEKSMFCYKKVTFLGYVLTEEGLSANPERVKPIIEYKRPETVKELRRLVGMIGWYRRFLPNIAETLAPLTNLMKGESRLKLKWNEEAEQAFERVKEALMSPYILASARYNLPYRIYTDASLYAGAAVLTQVHDGQERVIAFHSAKFSDAQQNYSATERECLAVLMGIEKFRPYVDGVQFTVVTDHASLKWLKNLKEPHGKLARWAVRLQAFDIVFEHRPGTQMVVPDALSRSVNMLSSNVETQDVWYRKMYNLAEGEKIKRYKISDGRLYHLGRHDFNTGGRRWALCVPEEKVAEVLAEQHNDASHPGYWKTLKSIQQKYYWPKMYEGISDFVRSCQICKQIKHTNENTRVPIGSYRDPISVGRVLSLDLVGPLPASSVRKYQWIIVAVDVFSKYVFTRACASATTNVIMDFLEKDIFYRFDTPEIVITDNGTQFISDRFKLFMDEHGIKHIRTPVYHPQSNPVEASNKSLKQLLRAELVGKSTHVDWASYLHKVAMRLNTTPRHPTGFSPHFLAFGREKTQKGYDHRVIHDQNANDLVAEPEKREIIYETAAEEQRFAFERNKERYNLRARPRNFNAGDVVWIKNHKQSSAADKYTQKLGPKRKMAYVKSAVSGTKDMYTLMDGSGKIIGIHHASEMHTR